MRNLKTKMKELKEWNKEPFENYQDKTEEYN